MCSDDVRRFHTRVTCLNNGSDNVSQRRIVANHPPASAQSPVQSDHRPPWRSSVAARRNARRSMQLYPPARSRRAVRARAGAALVAATLTACSSSGEPTERLDAQSAAGTIEEGLTYWSGGGVDLALDACLPAEAEEPTRAVVIVHGGGFTDGDRAAGGTRALCESTAAL